MKVIIANIILCLGCIIHIQAQHLLEKAEEIGLKHVAISVDHMGGGMAFFDYDNDGFEDLALSGGTNADHLYRNLGNRRFVDVTIESGLTHEFFVRTLGMNAGDINNDGFKDLLIVTDKRNHNLLYLNNGDGTFKDISIAAGFGSQRYSLASIFLDVNLDGLLDMYIVNWVQANGSGFKHLCYENQLYINNGDLTFTEISEEYGINDAGCGVAAVSTDINFDHIPDIYVANDFGAFVSPSSALINNFPQPNFSSIGSTNGLGVELYSMGVATGDINNDGLLDYYTTNIGRNALLFQENVGLFSDITTESATEGIYSGEFLSASWGAVMVDLDQDGLKEILVANGFIDATEEIRVSELDSNRLYKNIDGQHFVDKSVEYGFASDKLSRGIAVSDYDNDGDMDIGVLNILQSAGFSENMLFYENEMAQGNWLKLKLEGTKNNRDGYGTKVLVYSGTSKRIDELQGGSSFSSLNSSFLHFGLGEIAMIDSLEIIWPGGYVEKYYDLEANRTYLGVEMGGIHVLGCTNSAAKNYDPLAEADFGCFTIIQGCMDATALNYNSLANTPGDCSYKIEEPVLAADKEIGITVFPTAVDNDWCIQIPENLYEMGMKLHLIDLNGKILLEQNIESSKDQISRQGVSPGLYLLHLMSSSSEVILRTKLIFK